MKKTLLLVVSVLALGALPLLGQTADGMPDGIRKYAGKSAGETTATKAVSDIVTGRVTLVSGVGVVTTTKATATANIFPHRQTVGGTKGVSYEVTRSAGTSFTITALNASNATETSDTSVIAYVLIEP